MNRFNPALEQTWKKAVLAGTAALALTGVLIAVANMPVLTGCGFYNQCEATLVSADTGAE
jgi:hypothetical protein